MIWTFLLFYNHLGVRNIHRLYFVLYVIGSMCSVLFLLWSVYLGDQHMAEYNLAVLFFAATCNLL